MKLYGYEPHAPESSEKGAAGPEYEAAPEMRDMGPVTLDEVLPEAIRNIKKLSGEELAPRTLGELTIDLQHPRVMPGPFNARASEHADDIRNHYGRREAPAAPEAAPPQAPTETQAPPPLVAGEGKGRAPHDEFAMQKSEVEERWIAGAPEREERETERKPVLSWHAAAMEEIRREEAAKAESERLAMEAASHKAEQKLGAFLVERAKSATTQVGRLIKENAGEVRFLERLRELGETVNKMPGWQKAALSAGLLASGMGAAAVGAAGAAALIGGTAVGWRMVASAGTYAMLEAAVDRFAKERDEATKRRNSVELVILAAFAGGTAGQLGQGILGMFEAAPDMPAGGNRASGLIQRAVPLEVPAPPETAPAHAASVPSAPALSGPSMYVVRPGDNLTKILEAQFMEEGLGKGQKANIAENILREIRKDPAAFGIESGNADLIRPGDSIDLDKIREVFETKRVGGEHLVEHARGLPETAMPEPSPAPEPLNTIEPSPSGEAAPSAPGDAEISSITAEAAGTPGSWPALELAVGEQFRSDIRSVLGRSGSANLDILLDAKANDIIRQPMIKPLFGGFFTPAYGTLAGIPDRDLEGMGKYLHLLSEKSGMLPRPDETAERFARRALGVIAIREHPELLTTQ